LDALKRNAALAFNRVAQEGFDQHACATEHSHRGDTLMQIPLATFSLRSGELLSPHSRGMSLHLADKTSANTTSPANSMLATSENVA